jgi:hypothetical protein
MPTLHYGNSEILLDNDEARGLEDRLHQSGPTLITLDLAGGPIHLITGPGIPIWLDRRTPGAGSPPDPDSVAVDHEDVPAPGHPQG